ncbi:MAG: UDP-glucose 4-epimerase GalE [Desulfobacterales bacterium]|nr:UDP-glucose 4-epimerase GalE [Desulfobacterales bacterium]
MANVLVTGGAGYIGSHACKALAKAGYTPVTYDNLIYGHPWAVKWGPFEKGDVLDRHRLDEVIAKYRPEAVMHFAAFAYVGESVENPGKYYRNNVAGSLTILEAMRDHGIRNMVFSSTCAVYGTPETIPIPEDHPLKPINPYGFSKYTVERMLEDFSNAHDMRYVSLRYFNAAGADPDAETGEDHDPETHLIPLVLDAASGRSKNIKIFGTDYDTPDGTCLRDYVHVSDLAGAHVLALEYLKDTGKSDIFNLGNGNGFSVREVIETARKITGRDIQAIASSRRSGDPAFLVGSSDKIRKVLGWNSKHASIDDIIQDAWGWYQKKDK